MLLRRYPNHSSTGRGLDTVPANFGFRRFVLPTVVDVIDSVVIDVHPTRPIADNVVVADVDVADADAIARPGTTRAVAVSQAGSVRPTVTNVG